MSKYTVEQVRGAVARGWCHPSNSHKEMDSDLALAIADEVLAMLTDERIKADEGAAQSARERVEMALREPNSAKAAQVASELGAAHRAANLPAQAAQVDDIRLSAPAWPGQMEGKAPPDGWVTIEADLAPKPDMPIGLLGQEDFCFCHEGASLQSVSGGGSDAGYMGEVTIKVGDEFVRYIRKAQPEQAKVGD